MFTMFESAFDMRIKIRGAPSPQLGSTEGVVCSPIRVYVLDLLLTQIPWSRPLNVIMLQMPMFNVRSKLHE